MSVKALTEKLARRERSRLATGSPEVSNAEIVQVAEYLEERAADFRRIMLRHDRAGQIFAALEHFQGARVVNHCAQILRRHAAATSKRQPRENDGHEPRPSNHPRA